MSVPVVARGSPTLPPLHDTYAHAHRHTHAAHISGKGGHITREGQLVKGGGAQPAEHVDAALPRIHSLGGVDPGRADRDSSSLSPQSKAGRPLSGQPPPPTRSLVEPDG